MAIYHLSVSTRAKGYGAAHAAYIERSGRYADRQDLQASESGNLPAWAADQPNRFWQAADQYERANGRAYTEIEVSLPRELSEAQRIELVREFVRETLGDRHAYTWAIHSPAARDGQAQPHAHIMFTERVNDDIARDPAQFFRRFNAAHPERGGAGKDRDKSSKQFVNVVRERWAMAANQALARAGQSVRIDHRSYRDIAAAERSRLAELEPQHKAGASVHMQARGVFSDLAAEVREQMARNGERLIADPQIGLDALTAHQSVFTRRDIERFVMGHTDSAEQFERAMHGLMQSPQLLVLHTPEARGEATREVTREALRFTTQTVLQIETQLLQSTDRLQGQRAAHAVPEAALEQGRAGRSFNDEQARAFEVLTGDERLAIVHGAAGTGKSYVLAGMREAYEAAGFQVHGAILQGKTADDLERDSGIRSRTMHSFLRAVDKGELQLDARSVIVVDEAGLVGSRQTAQLLAHAERTGARVRLVGDTKQLHAVSFGDAFAQVAQRATVAGLARIQRQRIGWQREASLAFSRHEIAQGLDAYARHGLVHGKASEQEARQALLAQWRADRLAHPDDTQLIVTPTNVAREALNREVRQMRRELGELGAEATIQTEDSARAIAVGERLMFGRNQYHPLDVKNGTLGTVRGIEGARLHVELDDGRRLSVDTQQYGHLDYGYAMTVHKGQGVTVDRAYVLATPSMSAENTYVAMTRHRESAQLYYGEDAFAERGGLARVLSRAEKKEFSGRYEVVPRPREHDESLVRAAETGKASVRERFEAFKQARDAAVAKQQQEAQRQKEAQRQSEEARRQQQEAAQRREQERTAQHERQRLLDRGRDQDRGGPSR